MERHRFVECHRIEPVIELPDFPRPPCRSSCRAVIGAPFFATKIRFLAFQTPHWRAFFDTVITFCTVKTQPLRPMLPILNPFRIQRDSFSTPHSTFSTLHIINPSPPAKRSAICGRTFPCRMPHSTSNIPHPTFHIPHSTFSTSLPQIYTVFPVAPRLASKYAILAHFCNRLTFSRLPSEGSILLSPRPIQPCG